VTTQTESNKETIRRVFEAFRRGDTAAFDEFIVEDYVQHNPQAGNGLEAVKAFFAQLGPVDVEVYRMIAEGDLVACTRITRTGTWRQSTSSI
jgi:predicted SnoaL-like aldol condensation-catalyzing enzyme